MSRRQDNLSNIYLWARKTFFVWPTISLNHRLSGSMPISERPEQDASPLSEPSAWQLRFRRKPSTPTAAEIATRAQVSAKQASVPAPSIADQLLQSLVAREKARQPEQELSRQCAEQILGKRNAFNNELRMDDVLAEELLARDNNNQDVSVLAKEIIRSRMQVETQADMLRQAGKQTKQKRGTHVIDRAVESATERLRKIREEQSRRDQQPRAGSQPQFTQRKDGGLSRSATAGNDRQSMFKDSVSRHGAPTTRRAQPVRSQQVPQRAVTLPTADPIADMEKRQIKIREMRDARKLEQTPAAKRANIVQADENAHSNQREDIEKRQLQERISRVTSENQRAVELTERARDQKRQWEVKSAVFNVWKRVAIERQECVLYSREVLQWRKLQRIMKRWRHYSLIVSRERIASETRAQCAYEENQSRKADTFQRKKQLPRWFYRWVATVVAEKQRHQTDEATKQRRQQAQRLMERLVRGQEASSSTSNAKSGSPEVRNTPQQQPSSPTRNVYQAKVPSSSSHSRRQISAARLPTSTISTKRNGGADFIGNTPPVRSTDAFVALAPPPPSHTSSTAPLSHAPTDSVYIAMQERASERKERRELLKLKYERAQEQKREVLAMQVEDRAAALLRIREGERHRLREQKREAAAVARVKQEKLEYAAGLLRRARNSNRQRLLRYYAFEPWKFYFECRLRVSKYVVEWHATRVLHKAWIEWQALVAERLRERQTLEMQRLRSAGIYYEETLLRRVWEGWKLHLQGLEENGQIVQQRSHRFAIGRAFKDWQRRLQEERAIQYTRQVEVERKIQRRKLQRIILGWKRAASELKERRELEREKQQLWSKVRGWLDE